MEKKRKPYARYYIVRGHQAFWKGDPAVSGSQFRQLVITSDEFNSTQGTFQVYELEGTGKGIQDGKLSVSQDEPRILVDEDFAGLDAAGKKFKEMAEDAQKRGFKAVTLMDELEFQAKAREQKKQH
jgi:hypothetical protein